MALHLIPYLVDEINAATVVLLLLCLHCICCCGWRAFGTNTVSWSLFLMHKSWADGRNMEHYAVWWTINIAAQLKGILVLSPQFTEVQENRLDSRILLEDVSNLVSLRYVWWHIPTNCSLLITNKVEDDNLRCLRCFSQKYNTDVWQYLWDTFLDKMGRQDIYSLTVWSQCSMCLQYKR